MAKTQQPELKLQSKIIESLRSQGWFATKTSDRFAAGRPDLRIGREDFGQCDVELKFSYYTYEKESPTGLTKLQWLKLKEMNKHGMRAIGLVYSEPLNLFFVTTFLRCMLPPADQCVRIGDHRGNVINGQELIEAAVRHLKVNQ